MTYRFISRVIIPVISIGVATLLHHFLISLQSLEHTSDILLIISIIVISLFLQQLLLWLLEKNVTVKCKTILLDTEQKKNREARRGLIVYLSLYSLTQEGKLKWEKKYNYHPDIDKERFKEDVKRMNECKDYKALLIDDTSSTNFGTTTNAILTHKFKLQAIWIISTESKKNEMTGSSIFKETYEAYLQDNFNKERDIYINSFNTISVDEDSQIVDESINVLGRIYKLAKKKKYYLKGNYC